MKKVFIIVFAALCLSGCRDRGIDYTEPVYNPDKDRPMDVTTDKARYNPGDEVRFTLDREPDAPLTVRYRHLDELIDEQTVSSAEWTWRPPSTDFTGYLVEVIDDSGDEPKAVCGIGVDVSSDWTRFPRYGFLHRYGTRPQKDIESVVEYLTRNRINAVQYYDWLYAHHTPLAGTPDAPWSEWPDLMNKPISLATVQGFIETGHRHNIASMWYDLCFGALDTWEEDGIELDWFIFNSNSPSRSNINMHRLDAPFRSSIYVTDPSNGQWLDYFSGRVEDVYSVFDFDGYHIDQLGNRGDVYDYDGTRIDLRVGFEAFLKRMKRDFPDRKHAFNAVSRWGAENISAGKPDFFYDEVWDTRDFSDFSDVIFENNALDPGRNSVIASYVNYNISDRSGFVNAPGVLLGDAALFALGGSRIELGEHILTSEYFPKDNLKIDDKLQTALTRYYDFLVAYQNLLRGGGQFNTGQVTVDIPGNMYAIGAWPPKIGEIAVLCKSVGGRQVVHLLNFLNATTLDPRDVNGIQREPRRINSLELSISESSPISKVWVATPDEADGMFAEVEYTQNNGRVVLTLPALKYWTMVVLEK